MKNNSNMDTFGVPDHAEVVRPARQLLALHERDARCKLAGVVFWALLLLAVSCALSLVTGGVLTRLMPDLLAYLVGAVIHLAIGLAIHLLVVGMAHENRQDKVAGAIFLGIGLGALVYVFFARALVLIEEGRTPGFAWMISAFLLLIEIAVPGLLGYMLAKAWLAYDFAAEEAHFYRDHHGLIESSQDPAQRWNDAEDRLTDDIGQIRGTLTTAKPEDQVRLRAEGAHLSQRLHTLKEWNPTRSYRRAGIPQTTSTCERPQPGSGGNGHARPIHTLGPLPPAQTHDQLTDALYFG